MKKFVCKKCGEVCELTVPDCTRPPQICPFDGITCKVEWKKTEDSTAAPAKLTAKMFNLLDCPEWARFAAVDYNGEGFYYEDEPEKRRFAWAVKPRANHKFIGQFDASDWKNALIERPTKPSIPNWVKVGAWIWCDSEYFTLEKELGHDDRNAMFELSNGRAKNILANDVRPARIRLWNEIEMRNIVGSVFDFGDGTIRLCLRSDGRFADIMRDARGLSFFR